jgi:hypothetical protein
MLLTVYGNTRFRVRRVIIKIKIKIKIKECAFFLTAQKRSKFRQTDIYILYIRVFVKFGAKLPREKKLLGSKV